MLSGSCFGEYFSEFFGVFSEFFGVFFPADYPSAVELADKLEKASIAVKAGGWRYIEDGQDG